MFELITLPNTAYYQSDKIYGLNTASLNDQLFAAVAAANNTNNNNNNNSNNVASNTGASQASLNTNSVNSGGGGGGKQAWVKKHKFYLSKSMLVK